MKARPARLRRRLPLHFSGDVARAPLAHALGEVTWRRSGVRAPVSVAECLVTLSTLGMLWFGPKLHAPLIAIAIAACGVLLSRRLDPSLHIETVGRERRALARIDT